MSPDADADDARRGCREPTGPWPPLPPPERGGPPYDDDAPFGAEEEDDVKKSSKDGPRGPIRHEPHPVKLTDPERLERSLLLTEKLRDVAEAKDRHKAESKRLKDLVEEAEEAADAARVVVENGEERRQVEVQDRIVWTTRTLETWRLDTETRVAWRSMTPTEIQSHEQGELFAEAKRVEGALASAKAEPAGNPAGATLLHPEKVGFGRA